MEKLVAGRSYRIEATISGWGITVGENVTLGASTPVFSVRRTITAGNGSGPAVAPSGFNVFVRKNSTQQLVSAGYLLPASQGSTVVIPLPGVTNVNSQQTVPEGTDLTVEFWRVGFAESAPYASQAIKIGNNTNTFVCSRTGSGVTNPCSGGVAQ
jgi:hypothetical protein